MNWAVVAVQGGDEQGDARAEQTGAVLVGAGQEVSVGHGGEVQGVPDINEAGQESNELRRAGHAVHAHRGGSRNFWWGGMRLVVIMSSMILAVHLPNHQLCSPAGGGDASPPSPPPGSIPATYPPRLCVTKDLI